MLLPWWATFNFMVISVPFTADSGAVIVTADLSARAAAVESKKNIIRQNRILPDFFIIIFSFFITICFQDIFLAREKKREGKMISIMAFINNYLFLFKEGMFWRRQPAQLYHIKTD
jgi:hypothetical protein